MRLLMLTGIVLFSLGMHAKTEPDSVWTGKDPFYLQLYVGVNKSANENLPWTEFSGYPLSTGMFVGLGHELSRLWGWRAALRINRNKSRNVPECESKDVWGWNSTELFGDATFDVTDAFRKAYYVPRDSLYRTRSSRFNLKAFAGIGAAYTWNFDKVPLSYTHPYLRSSKLIPALRAGVTATYRLSNRWRVGAELSQTIFEDHFNGVAYDTPLDTRTNLKVGLTYFFLKKKKKTPPPVIRISRLKTIPPMLLMMPDPENTKLRTLQGHAFLDFPVNETVIYPQYRKNPEELAKIKKNIDSVMFDKSVTVTSIRLHGYASPESPYSNNTRLANGRTEALKDYLMRKYAFSSRLFTTAYTPEDWENLRGFLMNTSGRKVKDNFWYDNPAYVETPEAPDFVIAHRDELINVIDKSMNPDAKEELLKKVGDGQPYQWLLQHVYPGLRHTDYIIEYEVKPYSVAKGRRLIYIHPEAMSLEEMYLVAQSYEEGSDNWLDALMIAVQQYPDSETANYNAACACVMTKRLNDAKKYLAKAGKSEDAKYVANVIRAMEGSVQWEIRNGRLIVLDE